MRQDFRVKMDLSKIYQDSRQFSWIYIDSTKILFVNHLLEHIQKLFDIKKPFHLLSKYEDVHYFLPFEEDVRVLENNDTVIIMPGTGITNGDCKDDGEYSVKQQNGFVMPSSSKEKETQLSTEKSSFISKQSSSMQDTLENTSDPLSLSSTFYRTALHETVIDSTKDSKMTEDFTEDTSIAEDSAMLNKRKRIRKRKQKKPADSVPESDASPMESSGKKPKIIDSILISSGKHIRFQGLDEEEMTQNIHISNENNNHVIQNSKAKHDQMMDNKLSALLNLRQSSTPLTFSHRRMKRDYKPEVLAESKMIVETGEVSDKSNLSLCNKSNVSFSKSAVDPKENGESFQMNGSRVEDDTVSFKVFRMGEDYTPQLSNLILAKVLSYDDQESQYKLKILHGKEQLQDPEGKFSLPKDEDDDEPNDIVFLEKSKLLELTKVKTI